MCPTGSALAHDTTKRSNLRSAFDVLDVDHDGKISRDDLRAFYGGYSGGAAADEEEVIGSMMSLADGNRDGFVEYDEFEKVLGSSRKNGIRKEWNLMEDAFRMMDKDGDGKVGHEDLKNYLTRVVGFDDVSDEDVEAMIRLGGGHQNGGGVSYEALLKILAL